MEPQRVDPITGALTFLKAWTEDMSNPEKAFEENRATATNTELHGGTITIDTCLPSDTRIYETGIMRSKIEGEWVIVEQYPDPEAAKIGHSKWVNILTEYPDYPLKDIDMWSLDELKSSLKDKED